MKEASAHINTPALNRTQPFFQRTADETREDSAFFSGVQAKLNIGAKDDPYEKEADAMADKVVNKKTIQAKLTVGEKDDPYEKEADAMADKVVNKKPGDVQMKAEEQKEEEKKEVEEEAVDKKISKKPVADSNDTNEDKVQRMCRECDEGNKVFLSADPAISGMSKRDAVIAMAKTMLGKIKAKQSGGGGERFGAKELWEIFKLAAPGIWSEEDIKTLGKPYPSWCGIFSVWAHKKAGIDLGNWQIGKGVTAFGTLKPTNSPQPGDIGYIDQPFQHHCIVTKVNGDTIDSIDGNSGWFSEVIENTRPRTAYTGFFTAFSGSAGSTINKKENQTNSGTAPSSLESSLASSKGGGMGLPEKTRSEMESGFCADFSNVKIHTGSNAAQMSKDLNAQAFTHGNDIYFNENKYDTESKTGKQLLAHELTHTIQQNASPTLQKKSGTATPIIQKAPAATAADATKINDAKDKIEKQIKKTGIVQVNGSTFEIILYDFPLKQYANIIGTSGAPASKSPPEVILPKPGTRKTNQSKIWRDEIAVDIRESLKKNVLPAGLENEPDLELSLTGEVKAKTKNTKLIGSFDVLAKEVIVPFWDMGGHPMIHQIEHKVDWQILGNDADTLPNLLLLDKGSNMQLGRTVQADLKSRIGKILEFYRDVIKIMNLVPDVETAKQDYTIKIASFATSETPTKSILSASNLRPTSGNNPINTRNIVIKRAEIPEKHLVFKTSKNGAGFILPYDFKNKYRTLVMKGEIDAGTKEYNLKTVTITRLIRDDKGVATGGTEEVNLNFIKEKTDYYKLDQKGYAYSIKNKLKLKDLSPVILDDEPDLDPEKGVTATGKVESDISFLKDAKIDFGIEESNYFVRAVISPSFLRDNKKIPKPFSIDYGSVIIEASTQKGISIDGEVGFGIEKMGKGMVRVGKNSKGFNASGKFVFDKSVFDGEIGFTYENKKWTIEGKASMNGKKLKGIKNANIHFKYSEAEEVLIVGGNANLTVPGISSITIDSKIGKDGDFEVSAGVDLEKIPRIKSGRVTVKIAKNKEGDGDWDLGITGTIEPDFKYDGLTINSVKFGYAKGAYDISISAKYTRGKIRADTIEIGVTNKPVSADGKILEGEPTKDMTFYGALKMSVDIYDGISGEITCKLLPDGDITVDGMVDVKEDKQMFSIEPLNKEIFKVDKDIPIASCVVVTLNLYIGGSIMLYADIKPLMIKKGSYVKIGNLSLKKFDDPQITSKIILGSSLIAGAKVTLAIGLSASLLGIIKARISGKAGVDFVALQADIIGVLDMGWSKGTGLELKEASISAEMSSKLKVSFAVVAEVLVDLWLTTITVWDHTWPVAEDEFPINLFGKGKKTWKLPIENGGKVGKPKAEDNLKEVNDKVTPEEVQKRAQNKSEGKGQTDEDKQAQIQQVTQDEVIANFKNPDRFIFDRSENYLETRYGLYNYLKLHSGLDPKIDLTFIDEEIKKCESEEYDAFSLYIMNDTTFNDDAKSIIIEDFIVNHPTLGATEIANLRSLIPVKAPASQKVPVKDRGKTVQKKTPEITNIVRPVQKKAKPGAASKAGSSNGKRGKHALKHRSQKKRNESPEVNEAEVDSLPQQNEMELPVTDEQTMILPELDGPDNIDINENEYHFKPFYMRPYTRTRKPLQQRAEEKSKPFFSGPEKKEKKANNAFFQAKLNVGETDDPLEKEADHVADAVTGKGVQKEERKEDIAKGAGIEKPEQEANKEKAPGADKPAIADKPPMQKEKKEKIPVQRKEKNEKEEETNTPVNKKENAPGNTASKANSVETAIGQKNGKGESIPANTLQEMQSAFGSDFSDVRIHTDSEAATLSNELDAQAFTTGKDIYFNTGKFDPDSESGKHLLAHELTHVLQQNKDTIQRDPKENKEEKDRAQKVRDNYQKALKAKTVNWEEVALYFNAFNTAEQHSKMAQLNGNQLFRLHQGAINAAGVGPWSAAALITTPVPGMESSVAAAIEEKMLGYNYQEAIDLMIEYLDKKGILDRTLLWGGTMRYLDKANLGGEGRILAPGFDQTTGKAKPTSANIGSDAFRPSTGLPLLYSTIIHEYQHVQQMQKKDESKALVPDQGNDDNTHLQQEVEAYATELVRAKESGLFHNPEEVEGAWNRLQSKWEGLSEDRKKILNDIYKKAYKVAKEALGKKSFLVYTPLK